MIGVLFQRKCSASFNFYGTYDSQFLWLDSARELLFWFVWIFWWAQNL